MFKDIISQTHLWFTKAVPEPTEKNIHTQLGVHVEEFNEMLMVLATTDFETQILIDAAKAANTALSFHLKTHENVVRIPEKDREEYLDSLCDQIVTAVGCARMSDMDAPLGLAEVNRSNFSKFDENDNPIFDVNRKVMKGASYSKPDLKPFI